MSPELLMQPFEQSFEQPFNALPMNNGYYHHNSMMRVNTSSVMLHPGTMGGEENSYQVLGYHPNLMEGGTTGDFRPSFYNPFEIKHRRRTSRAQLKVLEKSFSENPKPNATVRRILAQKLDMTPRGVQIWFQNRRAKAKLQRRKSTAGCSGEDVEEQQQKEQQYQQDHQSPVLFSQFFNNLKAFESNNARNIANVAAASCMFDASSSAATANAMEQQPSVKVEEWFKSPIHPLAPVIDSSDEYDFSSSPLMSSEEWRRKSCPALGSRNIMMTQQHNIYDYNNYAASRRMTEDLLSANNSRFAHPYSLMRTSDTSTSSECSTPQYTTPTVSSIDFYPTTSSNSLMYSSPMSQQLTPMLSTDSPISSVDGGYYDSCLDLISSSIV